MHRRFSFVLLFSLSYFTMASAVDYQWVGSSGQWDLFGSLDWSPAPGITDWPGISPGYMDSAVLTQSQAFDAAVTLDSSAYLTSFGIGSDGAGLYTLSGMGSLNLNGGATLSQIVASTESTISLNAINTVGVLSLVNDSAAALQILSTSFVIGGDVTHSGSGPVVISSAISGAGALIQNGAGSLTLSGSYTYGGGTTITLGTLLLTGMGPFGTTNTVQIGAAGVLDISGILEEETQIQNLNGDPGGSVQLGGKKLIVTAASSFLGDITGGHGTLEITGGTFDFQGSATELALVLDDAATFDIHFLTAGTLTLDSISSSSTSSVIQLGIVGTKTLVCGDSGNDTFAGIIQGDSSAFTKTGSGALTLSGLNTYVGTNTLFNGTLSVNTINDGGIPGSLGMADSTPANIVFTGGVLQYTGATDSTDRGFTIGTDTAAYFEVENAATNLTISGLIVPTTTGASLNKIGAGTLTLSNSGNTYEGGSNCGEGTLSVASIGNLGDNGPLGTNHLSFGGGTLQYTGSVDLTPSTDRQLLIAGFTTCILEITNAATNLTVAGLISGGPTSALEKKGAGSLTVTNTNTYGAGTVFSAGALSVGTIGASGSNGPLGTGGFTFKGGTLQYTGGSTSTNRASTITNGSTAIFEITEAATNLTISGTISPATTGGALEKKGAGTLTFSAANTYSSTTTVSEGTLALSGSGSLASSAVTLASAATLNIAAVTSSTTLGSLATAATDATINLTGKTLITGGDDSSTAVASVISGVGGALTKMGSGTMTLSAANTYSSTTTVSEGTLALSGSGSLASSAVTLASAATLNIAAVTSSTTLGSLATAATDATINLTGKTLITGGDDSSTAVASVISGVGGALTKMGSGTMTLSAANTYSSTTTVSEGTLALSGSGSLASSAVTLASAATLNIAAVTSSTTLGSLATAATDATINLTGKTLITGGDDSSTAVASVISGVGGALTKMGSGTMTLSAANTYSSTTTVSEGTLALSGSGSLASSAVTLASGATLNIAAVTSSTTLGSLATAATDATINLGAKTLITGGDDSSTAVASVISGAGGALTKMGSGTMTLSAANTYTEITNVSVGTLALSGSGSLASSAVTLASAATLNIAAVTSSTTLGSLATAATDATINLGAKTLITGGNGFSTAVASVISGVGGALTKMGSGALVLSAANTYTGATTVSVGALALSGSGSLASSAVTLASGTMLNIAAVTSSTTLGSLATAATDATINLTGKTLITGGDNSSTAVASVISGAGGALTKMGSGTMTLSAVNTYSGATTVSEGTLVLNTTGSLANSDVTLDTGTTLEITTVSSSSMLGSSAPDTTLFTGRRGSAPPAASVVLEDSAGSTTVGSLALNAATLDLGFNTLNIIGTYTQSGASTLAVSLEDLDSGSITATGIATVSAGGTLVVDVTGDIPASATYTIISAAAGGSIVAPSLVVNGASSSLFSISTTDHSLLLVLGSSPSPFPSFASATRSGSNARAVAVTLDTMTNPSDDMTTVINALHSLDSAQINAALNTFYPEIDAGILHLGFQALQNFISLTTARVDSVVAGLVKISEQESGLSAGEEMKPNAIWGQAYGGYMDQDKRHGITGYDAWDAGALLGADHLFNDTVILGVSGGYSYADVNSKTANKESTHVQSAQATVYSGYLHPCKPFFANAAGFFAYNWYDGKRDIRIGDLIERTARADYHGLQGAAYVDGGYKIHASDTVDIAPLASLNWNYLHLNKYKETGAHSLNLTVKSQTYNQLQSGLGVRVMAFKPQSWGTFIPEAHVKWLYNLINDAMATSSNFTGGGAAFATHGCKPAPNGVNAGGQLAFDFDSGFSVVGACDVELRHQFWGIYGSLLLRASF